MRLVEERYSERRMVASYVEMEWADVLFPREVVAPFSDIKRPWHSPFYAEIAELLESIVETPVGAVIDVGCSTGRFCYEWLQRSPATTYFVLCDMSPELVSYARSFLEKREAPRIVPCVGPATAPETRAVEPLALELESDAKLEFICSRIEDAAVQPAAFDLVTALNVIDRHSSPRLFVEQILELVKPAGYVAVASPLDWRKEFTDAEHWVDSVSDLFSGMPVDIICDEDHDYPFRYSARRASLFRSQVIVARRR